MTWMGNIIMIIPLIECNDPTFHQDEINHTMTISPCIQSRHILYFIHVLMSKQLLYNVLYRF